MLLGIEIDIRAKNREGLLKSDIRNQIVPILQQMRGELNETTLSLRSEHIQEQEQFDEVEAQKNELMESMNENVNKYMIRISNTLIVIYYICITGYICIYDLFRKRKFVVLSYLISVKRSYLIRIWQCIVKNLI